MLKKISLSFLFAFVAAVGLNAQSFQQGDNTLTVGVGLGSSLHVGGGSLALPPLSATYEHGLTDRWGLGGIVGVAGARQTVSISSSSIVNGQVSSHSEKRTFDYSNIFLGARGAYHFYTKNRWDLYGGALLGLNIVSVKYTDAERNQYNLETPGTFLTLGLYAGAKYYFNDHFGVYTELGYSVAFLNAGVAFKL